MNAKKGFRFTFGRATAGTLALAIALQAPLGYAQSADEKASARVLAKQGAEALNSGKFADALDLVKRAEALMHAPTHVLMIARSQAGLGHYVAAQEAYMTLLHEDLSTANPTFKQAQESAKAELPAIEPKIASVKIGLDNANGKTVSVKIDEQPLSAALIGVYHPIDPGHHEIVATVVGAAPVKQSLDLREGEKKDVRLAIPDVAAGGIPTPPVDTAVAPPPPTAPPTTGGDQPPPPSGGRDTTKLALGITGLGVGVVGVVLGSVFLAKRGSSTSDGNNLYNTCNPRVCTAEEKSSLDSFDSSAASSGTLATTFFIVGGVGLVTGVILLATSGKKAPPPAGAFIRPYFGGTSGGFHGAF